MDRVKIPITILGAATLREGDIFRADSNTVQDPMENPKFWRIRMKYGAFREKAIWEKNRIGIWYGAWDAVDFAKADRSTNPGAYLSKVPAQRLLRWPVSPKYVQTVVRFRDIRKGDWVFTYFDDAIHLARTCSTVAKRPDTEFSDRQLFKYRRISHKKKFSLDKLPHCFRLLSSAGQGNVHEVHGTRVMIELLANSKDEREVYKAFRQLSWEEWLGALGPHGWESLCLGYLILEADYVPTGLDIGRTLPVFDIIGRNRNGRQIFAQCKKDPHPISVEKEFIKACKNLISKASVYLFAYGGCNNTPRGVRLITSKDLRGWFKNTENGKQYRKLLLK